jgi:hypothetical protein
VLTGGLRIIESLHMVDTVEDWSQVRSPSRARRRRRMGHPQRIRIITVPKSEAYQIKDSLIMHPSVAAQLRRSLPTSNF